MNKRGRDVEGTSQSPSCVWRIFQWCSIAEGAFNNVSPIPRVVDETHLWHLIHFMEYWYWSPGKRWYCLSHFSIEIENCCNISKVDSKNLCWLNLWWKRFENTENGTMVDSVALPSRKEKINALFGRVVRGCTKELRSQVWTPRLAGLVQLLASQLVFCTQSTHVFPLCLPAATG